MYSFQSSSCSQWVMFSLCCVYVSWLGFGVMYPAIAPMQVVAISYFWMYRLVSVMRISPVIAIVSLFIVFHLYYIITTQPPDC